MSLVFPARIDAGEDRVCIMPGIVQSTAPTSCCSGPIVSARTLSGAEGAGVSDALKSGFALGGSQKEQTALTRLFRQLTFGKQNLHPDLILIVLLAVLNT